MNRLAARDEWPSTFVVAFVLLLPFVEFMGNLGVVSLANDLW